MTWVSKTLSSGTLRTGVPHVLFETVVPGPEYNETVELVWTWEQATELAHAILEEEAKQGR